jgi:NAD-dependent SIR2 family protein deacetylase
MKANLNIDIKPQAHLLNILKNTRDSHPNFVVFLGAGASITSGITSAKQLINQWRIQYYEMYCDKSEPIEEALRREHWLNSEEEYSILFEYLYDQPSQRREFIESCIKNANPSWGYIYLVNLIRNKVFNTIFTVNFDDLLNEACYLFSNDARPIVCAHDSSIASIRITSQRPKIIKLHGDFLFDNIKNTVRELETLEQNTQEKFKQYAAEFGFIVIGYSGNDRSIMDTFNTLLRYDDNFPHGIYWCIRSETKLSKKVEALTRHPKFHIVEITGFDEVFAELHKKLNLTLQPEMSDPYGSLAKRLNTLIERINIPKHNIHPVIEHDIAHLGNKIASISKSEDETINSLPLPYSLLSDIYLRENKYEQSINFKFKELKESPSAMAFSEAIEIFQQFDNFEKLPELMDMIENSKEALAKDLDRVPWIVIGLMNNNKLDEAERVLELQKILGGRQKSEYDEDINFINTMIIKKKRGDNFSEKEFEKLSLIFQTGDAEYKMAVSILTEKYKDAEKILLELMLEKNISHMRDWTVIKLLIPHLKNEKLKEYFK